MIRLIMSFVLILAYVDAIAQKYETYCDIQCFGNRGLLSSNATVSLDFGDDRNVSLLGIDGKPLKFPSVIAVANFMAKRGWRLTETYVRVEKVVFDKDLDPNVQHLIMVKTISSDDEIKDGLNLSYSKTAEEKQREKETKQKKRDARNNSNIDDAYKY